MTITKHGLEYRATSLEDIAAEFDRLGDETEDNTNAMGTRLKFQVGMEAARVWRKAAAILRATKLEPPANPGVPMYQLGAPDPVAYAQPDGRIVPVEEIGKLVSCEEEGCAHEWLAIPTRDGVKSICRNCGEKRQAEPNPPYYHP